MTSYRHDDPVPPRRPAEEIADARAWANRIRAANPRTFGGAHCDDPADGSIGRELASLAAIQLALFGAAQ